MTVDRVDDRGAGKRRPAPTIGGVNNFRGHKKPSSGASGDDFQRVYLHKNYSSVILFVQMPIEAKTMKFTGYFDRDGKNVN